MHIPNVAFDLSKANDAEFEIIELESLYQRNFTQDIPTKPHRIKFFNLVFIEQGEGNHMIDFIDHPFQSGSFLFVQREQVHAFDFSNKPKGKVLIFTQAFLDQVHANMRLPNYTPTHLNKHYDPIIQLNDQDKQRCQNLICELSTEAAQSKPESLIIMYLFSALSLILHRLRPKLTHQQLSQSQSIKLARFMHLLFDNYRQVRDANWYANQINTTYKTLNFICKLATGITAKQLIDAYTILEVKRMLLVGNITSQQLAYDYGFDDASNFVKYFKKHSQLTPSQFQKKYLSNS